MWADAVAWLLAPVLRWQVRQVRRRARQLPEAQGHRQGVAGTGRVRLRLLIVGDSSAAGVGATTQAQALSGRLGEALAQRLEGAVVWQVIARRGDSTADSVRAVSQATLGPADVLVTTVGLADLMDGVPPARWLQRLDRLGRVAARRAGVHHALHCGLPPLRGHPLPNPLRRVLAHRQRRYDAALARWTAQGGARSWLPYPFEPSPSADSVLMAEDGLHPGPAVYALWAQQLAQEIATAIVPRLPETTPTRAVRRAPGAPFTPR